MIPIKIICSQFIQSEKHNIATKALLFPHTCNKEHTALKSFKKLTQGQYEAGMEQDLIKVPASRLASAATLSIFYAVCH